MKSTAGRGSCFRIELAADLASHSEVTEGDELPAVLALEPGQPEYRVLGPWIRQPRKPLLLERLLQNAGFAVLVAEDGAQAVERFRELGGRVSLDGFAPAGDRRSGSNTLHPRL